MGFNSGFKGLRRILPLSPLQASHPKRTKSKTLRTARQNWTLSADVLFVFVKLHVVRYVETTLNYSESPTQNSAGTVQFKWWSAGRSPYKYINTRRIQGVLEQFQSAITAFKTHTEVSFPHGRKQQVFMFCAHAQSHSPLLSRSVT